MSDIEYSCLSILNKIIAQLNKQSKYNLCYNFKKTKGAYYDL